MKKGIGQGEELLVSYPYSFLDGTLERQGRGQIQGGFFYLIFRFSPGGEGGINHIK